MNKNKISEIVNLLKVFSYLSIAVACGAVIYILSFSGDENSDNQQSINSQDIKEVNDDEGNKNKSGNNKRKINSQSIVGEWNYYDSQIMGGYEISQSVVLTITKNGSGDGSNFKYHFKQTMIDQMYGGVPSTEFSNGGFESLPSKGSKWKFSGGDYDYEERGGHIVIPSNDWNEGEPTKLTIRFRYGRGKEMIFTKSSNKSTSKSSNKSSSVYDSIDGTYELLASDGELTVSVYGDTWYSSYKPITGVGDWYDEQNSSSDSGIVYEKKLFDRSGYVEVGYISGKRLYYGRFTLTKQ